MGINILREIRLQKKTVMEWCEENNFPLSNLHRIIRAEANPTFNNLIKISEKLNVSLSNLLRNEIIKSEHEVNIINEIKQLCTFYLNKNI